LKNVLWSVLVIDPGKILRCCFLKGLGRRGIFTLRSEFIGIRRFAASGSKRKADGVGKRSVRSAAGIR